MKSTVAQSSLRNMSHIHIKSSRPIASIIRIASLVYGVFIVIGGLLGTLLAGGKPRDYVPACSPFLMIPLAAGLLASGFMYVGLLGPRMANFRLHYVFAGLLLAAPLATGALFFAQPGGCFSFCPHPSFS